MRNSTSPRRPRVEVLEELRMMAADFGFGGSVAKLDDYTDGEDESTDAWVSAEKTGNAPLFGDGDGFDVRVESGMLDDSSTAPKGKDVETNLLDYRQQEILGYWDKLNIVDTDDDIDVVADSDGLTNLAEFHTGSGPFSADTDDDGLADNVETSTGDFTGRTGTDPDKTDTGDDGRQDNVETWTNDTQNFLAAHAESLGLPT